MSPLARAVVAVCLPTLIYGCASWTPPPVEEPVTALKLPRMASDTVILEVAFAKLGPDDADFSSRLWPEVDEQHLPNDVRRQLAENGLRCGLIGSTLPAALREVLSRAEQENPLQRSEVDAEITTDLFEGLPRIQCRPGRPAKIVVRSVTDRSLALLLREDGQIRGESFEQAQCLFQVKTSPQGDGSVHVELTPEIEHGDPQTRYVGQSGAWLLESGRSKRSLESLRLETVLRPGQTLVLGCTDNVMGLGQQYFASSSEVGLKQRLLLIRLQQTQRDDRFELEDELAPIVSVQ